MRPGRALLCRWKNVMSRAGCLRLATRTVKAQLRIQCGELDHQRSVDRTVTGTAAALRVGQARLSVWETGGRASRATDARIAANAGCPACALFMAAHADTGAAETGTTLRAARTT